MAKNSAEAVPKRQAIEAARAVGNYLRGRSGITQSEAQTAMRVVNSYIRTCERAHGRIQETGRLNAR